MESSPAYGALCSTCGRMLNAKGECLPCLVRAGFDQPIAELASPVFGDFEIARREDGSFWELGRGAMGVTYRADDKVLNRSVALKVIDAPAAEGGGQAVRDRFLREARAAAAFRHPNVAGVFHFGASPAGDGCYYAMELVEGETLEALVRRDGPLKVKAALEIAVQVTRALIAAAAHGLIHRDLKPGNIMLARSDAAAVELEVKVIDFGLAKAIADGGKEIDLTKGGFIGTPAFASPEQFRGAPADARSDIYSLGVTLWYALTGEMPCEGKTIDEIRHCQSDLPLPLQKLIARKIPTPVIYLLRRVLAVDPTQRPASARELMETLESCRVRLGLIPPPRSKVWPTSRKFAATLFSLVAIGAAVFFTLQSWQPKATPPARAPAKSIAILPFLDLSQTKDQEYFSDGITEQIINSLARIHGLFVVARTTAFSFKNKNMDIREVVRQLGVSHVLEGSVSHGRGKVRIVAQLIDVATGYHLWSETYDSTENDLLSLQSDVATKVATALEIELHLADTQRLAKPLTQDPEAYDLYLRGRYFLNKRTVDAIQKARSLFEQAVAKDAQFALGQAGLADSYILLAVYGPLSPEEASTKAWPHAAAAIAADDQLAEGYASRAMLLTDFEWNWPAAEADYRKALDLKPNSTAVRHWYALHLAELGRSDEALSVINAAQQLDPLSPIIRAAKAKVLWIAHRYDDAIAQSHQALDLEASFFPAFSVLARAHALHHQYPEAIEAARKYSGFEGNGSPNFELAYAYAAAGNRADCNKVIGQLSPATLQSSPYDQAAICAALHDSATALRFLATAIEQRSMEVVWIRVDPRLDNLRSDPAFREVLGRLVPRR